MESAYKIRNSLVWIYAYVCNILLAKRFIQYIKQRKEHFDVVITTYSPIAGHILGDYMKKHNLCNIWIEDFRDPLTAHWSSSFMTMLTHLHGAMLMRRSDYVTVVSKGAAGKVYREAKLFGVNIQDKLKIISNGYDPEDRNNLMDINLEKHKLIFSYCGSIYKINGRVKNKISPLFEVLSDLITQKQIDKNFIKVQYAGANWTDFYKAAESYGMEEILYNLGKVSRDESLKTQRGSDIVLAAIWNNKGETGAISGKFFETLLVQRNVLAIITGNQSNSELSSMIKEIQCGFAYEEINGDKRNMNQLKEWILKKYHEKRTNGEVNYFGNDTAEKYSHPYLAKKFERLF